MKWLAVIAVACLTAGCGSSASPSEPSSAPWLVVNVSGGDAHRLQFSVPPFIEYNWCVGIHAPAGDTAVATVTNTEFSIYGPTGAVYKEGSDAFFTGQQFGGSSGFPIFGCHTWYTDFNVDRPRGTRYEMRVIYTLRGGTRQATVSGTFAPRD